MPRTRQTIDEPIALRRRILRAAFEEFMQRGYAGTSTLDIASRAKVSKRDLYAEFGSKHAMLEACIAERAERMRQPLQLPAPREPRRSGCDTRDVRQHIAARGGAP